LSGIAPFLPIPILKCYLASLGTWVCNCCPKCLDKCGGPRSGLRIPLRCTRISSNILNWVLQWLSDFGCKKSDTVSFWKMKIPWSRAEVTESAGLGKSTFLKNTTDDAYVVYITYSENFLCLLVSEVRHTCAFTDRNQLNFNNKHLKYKVLAVGKTSSCALFFYLHPHY